MFKRSLFTAFQEDLERGFTLSFQIRLSKLTIEPKVNEFSILSIQKNVSFSSIRLGLKQGKFILTLKNKKEKEETYYSEKQLKTSTTYHIAIKCVHDPVSNLH